MGLQVAQERREVGQPSGDQVDDLSLALDLAVDGEEPRAQQFAALALADGRARR